MASDLSFVEYTCDQMRGAGEIAFRKMFGEYMIYCDSKPVALVCDNQLFVKPTSAGRAFLEQPTEAPPYPGAKAYFLIAEKLDEAQWMTQLIALTARELPPPKPKPAKPAKTSKRTGNVTSAVK